MSILPHITIILLNWNNSREAVQCIESILKLNYPNLKILLVDNGSTDNSLVEILSAYPFVDTLELGENLGYAGGNNAGISKAIQENTNWIFLLNNDTVLDNVCLDQLINVAEEDSTIGVVGPMVYHLSEPDIIQSAGGMLDKAWNSYHLLMNQVDTGQFVSPHPVDFISGCGILIRREVFEQVGMLDERFYLYEEETDLCLRATKAGWKIIHVPAAKLWHKGVERNYQPQPYVTYYMTRNHWLLLKKHHAPFNTWLHALSRTVRTMGAWTIRTKWKGMQDHRAAMWQGTRDFFSGQWGARSG
jgi:GT2 family glycosyltransferase